MYAQFYGPFLPVAHGPRIAEMPLTAQVALLNSWLPEPTESEPRLANGVSFRSEASTAWQDEALRQAAAAKTHWSKVAQNQARKQNPRGWHLGQIRFMHTEIVPMGRALPVTMPETTKARAHKVTLGAREQGWLNYQPQIPGEIAKHTKPAYQTMGAHPLGQFLDKVAEIDAITKTACCKTHAKGRLTTFHDRPVTLELSTVSQELHATGIASYSLSSSPIDDEGHGDLAEGKNVGTEYGGPSLDLINRIEWEKEVKASGRPRKARLTTTGGRFNFLAESLDIPETAVKPLTQRLASGLMGRTPEQLDNDRLRVEFYGKVGSGLYGVWVDPKTPEPEQSMDELGQEDLIEACSIEEDHTTCERTGCACKRCHKIHADGGPAELGFQVLTVTGQPRHEPSDFWAKGDATDPAKHTVQAWDASVTAPQHPALPPKFSSGWR